MEKISEEIIENDDINTTFYIDITLKFRLLRTTYLWEYFFSNGILSMYHTCGQDLPFTYFDVSLKKKTPFCNSLTVNVVFSSLGWTYLTHLTDLANRFKSN